MPVVAVAVSLSPFITSSMIRAGTSPSFKMDWTVSAEKMSICFFMNLTISLHISHSVKRHDFTLALRLSMSFAN